MGTTYGYARVSTAEQNLDRQMDALTTFPVSPAFIYADKASGKDFNRPAYKKLKKRLKPDDVLVIKSIDRLGRDYQEIINEWRTITTEKRVSVVVLDMPILDTRDKANGITGVFLADLVLQLLSYVAQIERDNIRQRQHEGIVAAQARGVNFGRPRINYPSNFEKVLSSYNAGAITRTQAAQELGVSTSTFYRWRQNDCAQ